eukprot:4042829-Prymnesium_polylepis.1
MPPLTPERKPVVAHMVAVKSANSPGFWLAFSPLVSLTSSSPVTCELCHRAAQTLCDRASLADRTPPCLSYAS